MVIRKMSDRKKESRSRSSSEGSSGGPNSFNITLQYGIFADIDHDEIIDEFLTEEHPDIIEDMKVAKSTIVRSYNGDGDASQVGIVIAEMGIDGPEYDGAGAAMMVNPVKLIELEEEHRDAIEFLSDLHETLVGRFKRKKIDPRDSVYFGWNAAEAIWDGSDTKSQ